MDQLISLKRIPSLVFILCLAALMGAYTAQYGFHIHPCHLCHYHRGAYMVIGMSALAFQLPLPYRIRFILLSLMTLGALGGSMLAAYHIAIEHHWVDPPHACLDAFMDGNTLAEVKEEIMSQPVVPCDVVSWRLLGLSMTEYSMLLFLVLTALGIYRLRRYIKDKK